MEGNSYKLSGEKCLGISCSDADKLISAADGTGALLYIYALRMEGSFTVGKAAKDLSRKESEIMEAAERLRRIGLFAPNGIERPKPEPAQELPQYTSEDISKRVSGNDEFRLVVDEAQRIFGRMLNSADLKTLFGIYDNLGLPAEVIMLLLNHCADEARKRGGPGKVPSMRAIEKEAYVWHNNEILTLDMAENYMLKKHEQQSLMNEVKNILQISGRGFSTTERSYVESWINMGFTTDAIALAYDRTCVQTGGMQWKYMNSILCSWNEKNLHTAEEAMQGDVRAPRAGSVPVRPGTKPGKTPSQGSESPRSSSELARLEKILNKVKNG